MKITFSALLVLFSIFSCMPSYYKKITRTVDSIHTEIPDYSDLRMWAAHPYKKDPSDSIADPFRHLAPDSTVDVFFLHPTSFTDSKKSWQFNASIWDDTLNAKTDYSSILYQASVFNQQARIFAPRYRQAHLSMYGYADTARARMAFDTAYSDIRNAFMYYLEHFSGRPIIIAAHSQGTQHARSLLKEFFDNQVLKNRLVAAYLVGMPLAEDEFHTIPPCKDSLQTGCFMSWRTFRENYEGPAYIRLEPKKIVTNPLTWTTDSSYAPKWLHKGAILFKYNKLIPGPNDARVHGNILWVSRPKFPGSGLYTSKNYHIGDYNLFYVNIKENVKKRIAVFWKN